MKRIIALMVPGLVMFTAAAGAVETIVSHETDKYFFRDGRMERSEGQTECTYELDIERGTLTRTRVYDYQSKKIRPDDTVYRVETKLRSHPANAIRYNLTPVLRAVGSPDPDSVQTVLIEEDAVSTVTSTSNQFVISRAKRLR